MTADAPVSAQAVANEEMWSRAKLVEEYAGRTLRAAEVVILVRHREALSGRVLELGCGGGRLSGYLIDLARDFHGIDISPRMVAHCKHAYPQGQFALGDLRSLSGFPARSFEVIVAAFNVLDVLDDAERCSVLREAHRMLSDDGLLIMSSHNLFYAPRIPGPTRLRAAHPLRRLAELRVIPRRLRNRRRLLPLQRIEAEYAILNDDGHDFATLHYYVGRDAEERQLADCGFELIECLDLEGHEVRRGEEAAATPELHYVARKQ
jgi:SAM-dependent methyltransferase